MYRYWTTEEEAYLEAHYGQINADLIAAKLDRSRRAVERKAATLGLQSKVPGGAMYKVPWNKGVPGPSGEDHPHFRTPGIPWEAAGRMYYRRDVESKPEFYAHFVWEKHYGPISKGKCIHHKDGNPLNCSIENLECITRAKLVRLNYGKDLNYTRLKLSMVKSGQSWVDMVISGRV